MVKEKEMRSKSLKARTIITVLSAIGLLFISIIAPITVLAEDNATVSALQQAVDQAEDNQTIVLSDDFVFSELQREMQKRLFHILRFIIMNRIILVLRLI